LQLEVEVVSAAAGVGDEKACCWIVVGLDTSGRKQLLAWQEGYRESKECWMGGLRDLRRRGLKAPALALGNGGGRDFWAALGEVFPLPQPQLETAAGLKARLRFLAISAVRLLQLREARHQQHPPDTTSHRHCSGQCKATSTYRPGN
jgi:phage terminase large subunit-like protein